MTICYSAFLFVSLALPFWLEEKINPIAFKTLMQSPKLTKDITFKIEMWQGENHLR
jgi:hypothetical protein